MATNEDWKKAATDVLLKTTEGVARLAAELRGELEKREILQKLEGVATKTKQMLDDSGVTDQVQKATAAVNEQIDQLSGQKELEQVREKLKAQESKLDQALAKIAELEAELKKRGT